MKIAGQVKGGKRIGKKPRNLRKEHRNEQVLIKGGRLCYVMLCTVQREDGRAGAQGEGQATNASLLQMMMMMSLRFPLLLPPFSSLRPPFRALSKLSCVVLCCLL